MTPYLILDSEMVDTLTRAAKSGIDVKIIMPHIPDKWYAFAVAKTFYKDLLRAGVQILSSRPDLCMQNRLCQTMIRRLSERSIWITGVCICILNAVYLCTIIRLCVMWNVIFRIR